jgi:glycolate oxidase FAD binding subunit
VSAPAASDAAGVQEAVRSAVGEGSAIVPVAGGTHPATLPGRAADGDPPAGTRLGDDQDRSAPARALDVSCLAGVVDYDPAELTFTARPGTPLAEIDAMLASHGQHLPFDPPRLGEGATLGGAVAAGITGPSGFGAGIRDFVVGVRFVDGTGRLAMGGGKVVKNAAGFDLPKLMVGSLGRLGVITELSLKVFPRPEASATVRFPTVGLQAGLAAVATLARGPIPITALDLAPDGTVTARLAGTATDVDGPKTGLSGGFSAHQHGGVGARAGRLAGSAEPGGEVIEGEALWDEGRRFGWVGGDARLVVVPVAPRQVIALDADLDRYGASRRYGLGANVAWIAWPAAKPVADLSALLASHGLSGVALTGPPLAEPLLGAATGGAFARRVTAALDPDAVFAGGAR